MNSDENDTDVTRTLLQQLDQHRVHWRLDHVILLVLICIVILGNALVIFAVIVDRKLRTVTTNKFIASLAVSDLLVGVAVMPLSLYNKLTDDEWTLGNAWCQFHLITGVFSTTASIVHLVAISLDRYFAIMFPTEYQRHSVSTSTIPYIVMIWVMALAVSSTLFMENKTEALQVCWIDNPQYIVLSSFLSFFLPGAVVVYLYIKIFKKLRQHQLYMFGQYTQRSGDKRRSLPRVIIEEVRSRRGSRLSQSGSPNSSPTRRSSASKERSPSQPDIHSIAKPQQRWRSPTICAETLEHDRCVAAKKRVSIVPDPPSMDVSVTLASVQQMKDEHANNRLREVEVFNAEAAESAEAVRKLSDERKAKVSEKRRMSTHDCPNGVPIMAAFQKAYSEVQRGRRRSLHEYEYAHHVSGRHHLDTVRDEELEPLTPSHRPSCDSGQSIAETVIAMKVPPLRSLAKNDSNDDSISTDASQRPLLSVPCRSEKKPRLHPCIPPPTFLMVPAVMSINTPPLSPRIKECPINTTTLQVPRLFDCPSPCSVPSNSSHSSYTSASGSSDTFRRISMNSYGSSLTDATDSTFEIDSRRSSAWSTLRSAVLDRSRKDKASVDITIEGSNGSPVKKMSTMSRGKLRRIATQVTRAIRRKRRESMAIRRESRATRVVAAILMAFLICWIPFFCVSVFRGICTGFRIPINHNLHLNLFIATSWLGYAHSSFNPIIYMCLNKNFRNTMRKIFGRKGDE